VTDNKINPAILQLLEIIENFGDYSYSGKRNLKKDVLDWTDRWLVSHVSEQILHNPKNLDSDTLDLLKYELVKRLSDQLVEDSAIFFLQKHKLSVKLLSVTRKPKE
jgi:hypothetical protein